MATNENVAQIPFEQLCCQGNGSYFPGITYWAYPTSMYPPMCIIPSEARLYPGSIEIFRRRRRRRRRQPEVGLKTSISQQWSTGSLSDWQA